MSDYSDINTDIYFDGEKKIFNNKQKGGGDMNTISNTTDIKDKIKSIVKHIKNNNSDHTKLKSDSEYYSDTSYDDYYSRDSETINHYDYNDTNTYLNNNSNTYKETNSNNSYEETNSNNSYEETNSNNSYEETNSNNSYEETNSNNSYSKKKSDYSKSPEINSIQSSNKSYRLSNKKNNSKTNTNSHTDYIDSDHRKSIFLSSKDIDKNKIYTTTSIDYLSYRNKDHFNSYSITSTKKDSKINNKNNSSITPTDI